MVELLDNHQKLQVCWLHTFIYIYLHIYMLVLRLGYRVIFIMLLEFCCEKSALSLQLLCMMLPASLTVRKQVLNRLDNKA